MIIGLSVPPLLPYVCALIAKLKGIEFVYWAMDLQPELSISSKLISKGSLQAKLLSASGNYAFRKATKIVTLDKLMKKHIYSRSNNQNIGVIPVWPVLTDSYCGRRLDNPFRKQMNFGDKIVIMYSGNHSFVHPLDTHLRVAELMKDDPRFLFVFIGEGTQKRKVLKYIDDKECQNIIQLPYQPKEKIHLSLSSGDFQVVVMGGNNNGFTHPNKIYGAMLAGCAIIYIGPQDSFIGGILKDCPGNLSLNHGEEVFLKNAIIEKSRNIQDVIEQGNANKKYAEKHFDPEVLKEKMYQYIVE